MSLQRAPAARRRRKRDEADPALVRFVGIARGKCAVVAFASPDGPTVRWTTSACALRALGAAALDLADALWNPTRPPKRAAWGEHVRRLHVVVPLPPRPDVEVVDEEPPPVPVLEAEDAED